MANKFVIDININGAEGSPSERRGTQGAQGAGAGVAVGAAAGHLGSRVRDKVESPLNKIGDKAFQGKFHGFPEVQLEGVDRNTITRTKQGLFRSEYKAQGLVSDSRDGGMISHPTIEGSAFAGSRTDEFMSGHRNQMKTLGVAAAWKGASTAVDLKNYRSGDSYANQQRDNAMRLATMGAAIIATGGNPLVIGAMVGNEAISAYSDYQKYTFDRKMESQEIFNIKQIAGDVSYGINRRGGF